MLKSRILRLVTAMLSVFLAGVPVLVLGEDQEIAVEPKATASITIAEATKAKDRPGRIITREKLPPEIKAVLGIGVGMAAVGRGGHPFTTRAVNAEGSPEPTGRRPWLATGKLFAKFGAYTYVCTASVIDRALLVTAAHCVQNYKEKEGGMADAVTFQPGLHGDPDPQKTWKAKKWFVPKVYFDGADACSKDGEGVVCENDIAVLVMEKNSQGKNIAELTGQYRYPKDPKADEYGYVDFLERKATQITQLGYPSENYDGLKMIRTDSLGYQAAPSNLIIGSNQTGGSSGGPWLMNFGTNLIFTGSPAQFDDSNMVVATTSWGMNDDKIKIQGGSRFSKNTTYTTKSNIQSLVDTACAAHPDACGN